jgi:hypothetical protein
MVDDMFETQLDLENNYLLQVIGGGVDPKQLERWSRETIQKHNPNGERLTRDAIYYPKHQNRYTVPFYGPSTSGIRWHCKGNVPCADIQPGPNGSPPMYYFLVNVTVIQSDVQVSYCRLSTTFPIGVVGIPLAFQHRITTISTTFSACIVAFCVYLWFRRDEYHLQSRFFQRRVVPIQKGVRFEEANDLWSEEKRNRKIYPEDDIEDVGQEDYIEGDGSDGSDGSEASEGSEEQDYESNSDEEALEALEDQDLDQDFEHDESEHEFSINGFKFKGSINSLNRLARDE